MITDLTTISSGTITTPRGFQAGAVKAGIKRSNELDLAVLYSEKPCTAAGVFTTNAIKAAPVILSQRHIADGRAQAVVVNSGCANACTGDSGMADAIEVVTLVSRRLGLSVEDILIASTGVIGVLLPMGKIRDAIAMIDFSDSGGTDMARAIMTTDTFIKETAVLVEFDTGKFTIGGVAKGAGMIHPNMATMLCFLTTDAHVDAEFLRLSLQLAVEKSFNMVTIDGDTSPSDMAVILANGSASDTLISEANGKVFQEALSDVCLYLAKCTARDGEGATKLIEVIVDGAVSNSEARLAARTVAGSPLVKAAIHGNDPNWGRIVAALGRSGASVIEGKLDLYLCSVCLMNHGYPMDFNKEELSSRLANSSREVCIELYLNLGYGKAKAWGCDLSEEYVTINSAYTT